MLFNLFKRKLRKHILLLCALPLERSTAEALYKSHNSDFLDSIGDLSGASDFDDIWAAYRNSANQLSELLTSYESAGATVLREISICDFSKIDAYDVVVLIAHHVRGFNAIELCGKQVETRSIVEAIPQQFCGVMDISSCYSTSFQLEVKLHSPGCRIIATQTATSLRVRLKIYDMLLEHMRGREDDYLDSFREVVQSLIDNSESIPMELSSTDSLPIHLGGTHRSTVYAPGSVCKGDTFLVQLFLHKAEEGGEVELQARMVDETSSKRNSKPLSIRLSDGDKIDIALMSKNKPDDSFEISPSRQSVVWRDELMSAEFAVSVAPDCTQSSFIGMIMIVVNKDPVGSMMFRTTITNEKMTAELGCAEFVMIPYDKTTEMRNAQSMLEDQLQKRLDMLSKLNSSDDSSNKEKILCERCLHLLSESREQSANVIPRVFISSTSDMLPFRKIVEERVRACEMFPDMYELWGQGNEYPRDMCCKHVLQSDYFVCILGSKYGFVEPIWDRSMTEIEYRVAKCAGIPILIYIQNGSSEIQDARQVEFRTEVKSERLVGVFSDTMSLAIMVNSELLTLKNKKR